MTGAKKNDKTYSVTEVGALVESLRNDVSAVAEDLTSVKKDVTCLKTDVSELKTDMKLVKDAIRISIPMLTRRVSAIETKIGI